MWSSFHGIRRLSAYSLASLNDSHRRAAKVFGLGILGCGLAGTFVEPWALGDEGKGRWITYQTEAGETLYALSVMPTQKVLRDAVRVAVVVDTSASQTGLVRRESLVIAESLIKSLSSEAKVSLFACDVEPSDLSGGLQSPDSSGIVHALEALHMRTPLGTTDLSGALMAAQRSLGDAPDGVIVYIGDAFAAAMFWIRRDCSRWWMICEPSRRPSCRWRLVQFVT